MSGQDDRNPLLLQKPILAEQVMKQVFFSLSVQSTEDIIEKKDLFLGVDSACNGLRQWLVNNNYPAGVFHVPVEPFDHRLESYRCSRPILDLHGGKWKCHL